MQTSPNPPASVALKSAIDLARDQSHPSGALRPTQRPSSTAGTNAGPDQPCGKDPHGLADGAPLVFAAYRVAIDCHPKLLERVLTEETVVARLRHVAARSAFQLDYVARQAFKLINPYGHGANSSRFRNETLGWFRQEYPEDAHLTAGFILLLCTAKWWTHEQGQRSVIPRVNPLTTSDLDRKLKAFGFLAGERQAICRMLRRRRS